MNLDNEKYLKVRKAQGQGARTADELQQIENLLKNACKCKNVSIQEVINAVNNGADTVAKVGEATGAGTVCGKCKGIISYIVENKR